MKRCPHCGEPTLGAFYMGLPGWGCDKCDDPPIAGGPAVWLASNIGLWGGLWVYDRTKTSYWRTLWRFVCGAL